MRFFTDSVFNIKNDFNRQFASALIEANLGVKSGAYFSPYQLHEEDFALFQEAGLTHVEFGTESLAEATLSCYGKSFQVKDVFRVAAACDRLGLYQARFLISFWPVVGNADSLGR